MLLVIDFKKHLKLFYGISEKRIYSGKIYNIEDDVLDQIFDVIISDFSKFALELYSSHTTNKKQEEYLLKIIKKPKTDKDRFERIWKDYVFALKGAYKMND